MHLPEEIALFRVRWTEDEDPPGSGRAVHEALAVSGPILCNDVDLNPAPGRVAACVPFADRAEARLVPSSPEACAP